MSDASRRAACLIALLALMAVDGVNGTWMVVNRGQVMGGYAATPDEAAWLNIAYLAAKLHAFMYAPWLVGAMGLRRGSIIAGALLAAATAALAFAPGLGSAVAIRVAQGASGALLLVAAQTWVFAAWPARAQPWLQAALALSVLVVPMMIAPALHGWVSDAHHWRDLFFAAATVAALACIAMLLARTRDASDVAAPAPAAGMLLWLAPAVVGGVYVLQEGARFDWFDAAHLRMVAVLSGLALVLGVRAWSRSAGGRSVRRGAAGNPDFVFGLCASVFAGFALFGSGAAIPLFGSVVLALAPEHVGQLALSSAVAAALGLAVAALALHCRRVPAAAPIPFGIALFMAGMWLLSYSSAQTGAPQMTVPTWLRGCGMGVLFVSLTMMTLGGLPRARLAEGVALFNLGRQLGGLGGVAFVATTLEWRAPAHGVALSQHLQPGAAEVEAAQWALSGLLVEHGYATGDAAVAGAGLLARMVQQQSAARAFDEIFLSLSLFFLVAIPVLVGTKALLARRHARRPTP